MSFDSIHALQLLRFDEEFDGTLRFEEPMSHHTTYRVGGPARCFAVVDSVHALAQLLEICERDSFAWTVVGKGSNLLVSDQGYEGLIIVLGRDFKRWTYDEATMRFTVGAGVSLSRIVQEAFHHAVSGMEFAVGTPGTLGGVLRMNAGTRTEWIGSRVVTVTIYDPKRGLVRLRGTDIDWEYRHSSIPAQSVVVECVLEMHSGAEAFIRGKMEGALKRRKNSQPLEFPSCGSVFRNPDGESSGALIENVGMKGVTCGGAQVSEKHANFIVNKGGATADDIVSLIQKIQSKVKQAYGIELQPEVRFLGFTQR
ncbi:MAG: UDP-N-acetylmuramate dehydrogenase [Eggerthellaceae bacterium]|jgi:UDP-N-acetylmuramate dehydrogenase|nr:UDP-N-acetylmuramate dehydrogenase [Eggerthellaceae bacterium]MCH4220878.1 UDP-N-acetylmuramate dehydrogenase [Eggerthellaceae bacterium]